MARAVVVAAGRSRRMGEGINKQLLSLAGRPVLAHSLAALEESSCIEEYVLVVGAGETEKFAALVRGQWGCRKLARVVPGGLTRQDSVWEGLQVLPADTQIVVVHDGARPFLSSQLVDKVVAQARRWGAATLAVPVKDTVKRVNEEGFVLDTLPRESLWLTQTPQAFSFSLLREAHRRARGGKGALATDDASLVEAMGCPVKVVEGLYMNIKITTPEDLVLARALAQIKEIAEKHADWFWL